MEQKKSVGRPQMLLSQRRHKQSASITNDTLEKARRYFNTLGKAIDWAVEQKDFEINNRSGGVSSKNIGK